VSHYGIVEWGRFRCAAKELSHPALVGWTLRLRIEGDSDEPAFWHHVKTVGGLGFSGISAITVAFHDDTPDLIFNETDEVELAVPRTTDIFDC
jgi:hypothetical protein